MESGSFRAGGLMGRRTSLSARFKRARPTRTILPLWDREELYFGMPMSLGLEQLCMGLSPYSLNVMCLAHSPYPTREFPSFSVTINHILQNCKCFNYIIFAYKKYTQNYMTFCDSLIQMLLQNTAQV